MFLVKLFKKQAKTAEQTTGTSQALTKQKTVDPTHIGDLGEYKIDIQLRQMPKEYRYLNDVLLPNSKSHTGYSQIDHVLVTPCQNHGHIKAVQGLLKEFHGLKYISMVSFTKRCTLNVEPELREIESDELILYDIKFTDYIERKVSLLRREGRTPIAHPDVERIIDIIRVSNILDPATRELHVKRAGALHDGP